MSTDCCEFCGSFSDCYDSCIGKDVRPIMEEIEKLRDDNLRMRGALVEIMATDRDHLSARIARRALGGEENDG